MIALLVLVLAPLQLDEAAAAAQLAAVRAQFTTRDKAQSLAALDALVAAAPDTEAGGQAAVWLGDLSRQSGDRPRAGVLYGAASHNRSDGVRRLALRGLGDLALAAGEYRRGEELFNAALVGAGGVLAADLLHKRDLAQRLRVRAVVEKLAWGWVALTLAWLGWRGRGARLPVELWYALPVYALLWAGSLGRDPLVVRALALGGAGSLLLIAASGRAARAAASRRWLQAALVVSANLALFYAVLNRLGLIDTVLVTAQM